MNRRGFVRALFMGAGAVAAAPFIPFARLFRPVVPPRQIYGRILFKGVPLIVDPHARANTIYFINLEHVPGAWQQTLASEMKMMVQDINRVQIKEL